MMSAARWCPAVVEGQSVGGLKWQLKGVLRAVQTKGGKDQIGIVQTTQDIRFVEQKFPGLRARAIAAQFMEDQVVALFELALVDDEVRVVEERHYRLVPASDLDREAIRTYREG